MFPKQRKNCNVIGRKPGFSVVEIVIVIAVIAILAAVLIPTFAWVVQKNNRQNDLTMVEVFNTAIAKEETEGAVKSIDDALALLKKESYTIEDLTTGLSTSKDNVVVWDESTGNFVLVEKDTNTDLPKIDDSGKFIPVQNEETNREITISDNLADIWVFVDSVKEEAEYAQYIKGEGVEGTFNVKAGISVGENKGTINVTYESPDTTAKPQKVTKVTIVMYNGELTLKNARGDDINLIWKD